MSFALFSLSSAFVLFIGMLFFGEFGRRVALHRAERDFEGAWRGIGVVDGAVFGLLGLLLAFTFSGAVSRFDVRRSLVVEESNAISTAFLRLDLLPKETRATLSDNFRKYLDSRIRAYRKFPDVAAFNLELKNGMQVQTEIWKQALGSVEGSQAAAILLLPALNQMFDIATKRSAAIFVHPPTVIFVMLFALSLVGSLLAGYSMARAKSRHWVHAFGFAAVTALAFYVILDIEFPRLGFIRVDDFDQMLLDLRNNMG